MREFAKHGKSVKYIIDLVAQFDFKSREAIQKFKEKLKQEVIDGKRGSSYPILKRLAARPHANNTKFHLPSHADFTAVQSAEVLADHFSSISQEYEPLSMMSLPPNIRNFLTQYESSAAPSLTVSDV